MSLTSTTDQLSAAGFTTAAKHVVHTAARLGRLARAYEHYRYVPEGAITEFKTLLKRVSLQRVGQPGFNLYEKYDTLRFTPIDAYKGVPPADVLEKVIHAKHQGIFDTFEVADIQSVVEYKDPIIFGLITGCPDRFFIAQWGDDVSISQIIGPAQG